MSFIRVEGLVDGLPVTIERPFEFFMPANQRSDGQQWITSSMRLLSMLARAGGPIAKALADMREVVWEKGPVRCGFLTREDGVQVPVFHDSEVAAVGFMLQRILIKRGFLDSQGNQVPVAQLAARAASSDAAPMEAAADGRRRGAGQPGREMPGMRRPRAAQGRRLHPLRQLPICGRMRLSWRCGGPVR